MSATRCSDERVSVYDISSCLAPTDRKALGALPSGPTKIWSRRGRPRGSALTLGGKIRKDDKMNTEAYFRLRTLGLVALLLIGTIIWTGCGGGETPPETKPYLVPGLVIRLRHSENLPDSCRAMPYLHLFGGDLGAPAGEGFEWWMIADDLNSNPSSWKLPPGIALGLTHSQNLATHSGITVFGNNPVSQGDFAGFERRHGGDIKAPSGEGFYWYESTGEFFSKDDWVIAEKLPKGTVLGLQHSVNQPETSVSWQGEGPYWPSQTDAPTPKGFVRRSGGDIGASAGQGYYWFEKVTGPNPLGKAADDVNCGW
jgi:hypothetical protein